MNLGLTLGLGSRAGGGGAIGGLAATTFAETPTYQYHFNTAGITTLGGNATVTAAVSGNTLTVSAHSGDPIVVGMLLFGGANPTNQFGRRVIALGTGTGGTGTYTLSTDASANIASSSMTLSGDFTILSVAEKNGGAAMTASPENAPILMTDLVGRKFLRFPNLANPFGTFAQIAVSGVDTHNMSTMAVARIHGSKGGVLVQVGTAATHFALGVSGAMNADAGSAPYPIGNAVTSVTASIQPANYKSLFVGTNMQVISCAAATADGIGGGSQSTSPAIRMNEQVAQRTVNVTRRTAQTVLTIGKDQGTGRFLMMDLYELSIWTTGQWDNSNYVARSAAAQTACMDNYAIVPFTSRVVVYGDSRTEESFGGGYQLPLMLSDEGRPGALPKTTQVISIAGSGGTIRQLYTALGEPYGVCAAASRLSASDKVIYLTGINEISTSGVVWPDTNTAASTTARADEVYAVQGALDATFTATISGTTMTLQSLSSGRLYNGQTLTMAGVAPGTVIRGGANLPGGSNTVGATFALSGSTNYSIASATAATGTWWGNLPVVEELLARGFLVGVGVHVAAATGAGNIQLRSLLRNNLLTDADAGPGQTYDGKLKIVDLPLITEGGVAPFGANYGGTAYFRDITTHWSDTGRELMFDGGDTPQYAWRELAT